MGGVDKLDCYSTMHKCHIRVQRWYLQIFFQLIYITISNSWLIFREKGFKMHLRTFISSITTSIEAKYRVELSNRRRKRPLLIKGPVDAETHWPIYNEKRNRCFHCKTGYTFIKCETCDKFLCLNDK